MKKSLIALLVVLALIVTVSVFTVGAEETIQWDEWTATDSLPTSGNWKLTQDVTLSGSGTSLSGDLYLDLNGCTVTNSHGIYNAATATLRIKDSQADAVNPEDRGKMVVTVSDKDSAWVFADNNGEIIIESGIFDARGYESIRTTNIASTCSGIFQMKGKLTIEGGTFYGMSAVNGYGTVIGGASTSEVVINGGTFYGNTAKYGGIIGTNGTLTIDGGTFYGGTASSNGGMIHSTGTLTINGGTFDGNTASGSTSKVDNDLPQTVAAHGGLINSTGTLTITGGDFKAGAVNGSGGIAYCTGDATISGGTYTAANQTNYGGFFRFDKNATITGVTLSGGAATTLGDNIAFCSAGTLTIGENAVIDGGIQTRSSETGTRIVLKDNATINPGTDGYGVSLVTTTMDVSELNNDAKIYVRSDNTVTFIDKLASAAKANELVEKEIIVSGDSDYNVVARDNRIVMQIDTSDWTEWNDDTNLPTTGSYKLITDVNLTNAKGDITTANVKLDLNGHTVTNTISQTGASYVYQPAAGYTLLITDSKADTAQPGKMVAESGNNYTSGCGMFATKYTSNVSLGKIIIDNGIFDGSGVTSSTKSTCGIFQNNGDLIINGGTFYGMNAASGSGSVIGGMSTSNVEINGGTFYADNAANGGIVYSAGAMSISGGTFYNENADGETISGNDIICVNGSKPLIIKDVTLTGGVEITNASSAILAGDLKIDDLIIAAGKKVDVSGLSTDAKKAKVCVTYTDTENAFTSDLASAAAAKKLVENGVVVSADNDYLVVVSGNALAVAQWQAWTETAKLPTSGYYRLQGPVGVSGYTLLTGDLNLDLNGQTVTCTATATSGHYIYRVNAGHTLRITDLSNPADPANIGKMKTTGTVTITSGCGMFYAANTGKIIIDNGIFDGSGVTSSSSGTDGNGIFQMDGNLTINGGTFYGMANNGYGATIGARTTSTVIINDGTFYGAKVARGGIISSKGTLTINGGTFDGNATASNTAVDNSKPKAEATAYGGLIYATGNVNINSGTFQNGYAKTTGGIMYTESASTVTITGGTFQNGKANTTGGIMRSDGNLTITGASISGGSSALGNAIAFCSNGTLTIGKDAEITGGIETRSNEANTKIVLKDNAKILPGTSNYALKLVSTSLDVSGLNDDAKVYVTPEGRDVAFTADLPSVAAAKKLRDNEIVVSSVAGWYVDVIDKALALTEWQRWTAAAAATAHGGNVADNLHLTKLPITAGSWRLIDKVDLTNWNQSLSVDLNLDLNGQIVTNTIAASTNSARCIYNVAAGKTLQITDTSENKDGTVRVVFANGVTYGSGCGMFYAANGTPNAKIIIDAGIFDGRSIVSTNNAAANSTTAATGIFQLQGDLEINGGTFYGMEIAKGYGTVIGARSTSNVEINGGTFYGNTATCGGIISSLGTVTIDGGTFYGGQTTSHGGMIYSAKTLTINGGLFDGNNDGANNAINPTYPVSRSDASGGLVVSIGATVNITDGTFQNGKANKGGLLYADGSTNITLTGGTFQNGHAITDGGNLYLNATPSDLVQNDGKGIRNATFIGGTSGNKGGSVYAAKAATFTDCSFDGGTAVGYGGNVYAAAAATFTDCSFDGGTAGEKNVDAQGAETAPTTDGRGGNLYIAGNSTLTDCTITNGKSYTSSTPGGGNILYAGSSTEHFIQGCTITGGYGYNAGGNINVHATGATLTIEDSAKQSTEISGGQVGESGIGANIAVTSRQATLNLKGNTCVDAAGNSAYYRGISVNNTDCEVHLYDSASIINGGDRALALHMDTDIGKVVLHDNYSGQVCVYIRNSDARTNGVKVGEELFGGTDYFILADNFVHDGNLVGVRVADASGSGKPVSLRKDGTGNVEGMYLSSYGIYVPVDENEFAEYGYESWNEVVEKYNEILAEKAVTEDDVVTAIKLYNDVYPENGVSQIDADDFDGKLVIDLNERTAHFINNGTKVAVIHSCTNTNQNCTVTSSFTVSDNDNVALGAKDPVTGHAYLSILEDDGTWSSNCVSIKLTGISLRPTMQCTNNDHPHDDSCGVYYTAKITANEKVASNILNYGIVAGLESPDPNHNNVIDENFKYETWPGQKTARWQWTSRSVTPADLGKIQAGEKFNSGMIANIMCKNENVGDEANAVRGQLKIAVKVYAVVDVGDEIVTILSDETSTYSVKDLAEELAKMYPDAGEKQTAIGTFLNKYDGVIDIWVNGDDPEDRKFPNLYCYSIGDYSSVTNPEE